MTSLATNLISNSSFNSGNYPPVLPQKEMTLNDLFAIFRRRKLIIFVTLAVFLAAGIFLFSSATRLYEGTAEMQVQKDTADALDLSSMVNQSNSAADSLETNTELQTEAKLLESESLALRVIKALHLEDSPDFHTAFNPIGWVLGLMTPAGQPDRPDAPLEESPARRAHIVKIFESRLKVKPVAGTRLITVSYLSTDPKTAAAVANLLVQDLVEYSFETRHDATQKASGWLTNQLSDLRQQSQDLQAKLVDLQHVSGMYTLGQVDNQGREEVYTPVLDQLQKSATDLQNAKSARILKGALYQVVQDGDPELISTLAGNSTLSSATPGVNNSLELLQNLRSQEAAAQAQLSALSTKFGSAYPKVTEVQSSLNTIQDAIRKETERLSARVKNDYLVAQNVERQDASVFQSAKDQALALNDKAIEYQIVQQESQQSRNLYERLLARMKEADLVSGIRSTNITLADPASVPARPKKPSVIIYIGAAMFGGLFIGVCLALVRDSTDQRFHDIANISDEWVGTPIGVLPFFRAGKRVGSGKSNQPTSLLTKAAGDGANFESLVAVNAPHSAYTEALRALRTALTLTTHGLPTPKVILVTSSIAGEGKSTLALNLATVFALANKRVLLVDGDLRTPVLHRRLGLELDENGGLSTLLQSKDIADSIPHTSVTINEGKTLHLIQAGPPALYPAELLVSDSMSVLINKWRSEYDCVIIDGAPLVPITDSALMSRLVDFTLVVVRHGYTDKRVLDRTSQILRSQGVQRIGMVVNAMRDKDQPQYSHYGREYGAQYRKEFHA